ncbi:MAG: glycoside hydrolase family 97 protein [Bacteroidales bacterium]|nr:glycoside hydrolase family 97 protein [Bacteroidales bacterium]
MKHCFYILLSVLFFGYSNPMWAKKVFTLYSPDAKVEVKIIVGDSITYSLRHEGELLLKPSCAAMQMTDGSSYGLKSRCTGSSTRKVRQQLQPVVYKKKIVDDHFNELTIHFIEPFQLIFRAYNDGFAYRFVSLSKKPFVVKNERAEIVFPDDAHVHVAYVNYQNPENHEQQYKNSFENTYRYISISDIELQRLIFMPVLAEVAGGRKLCITEADLLNYAGMFLNKGNAPNSLRGIFAPYPKELLPGDRNIDVISRENYIARYSKGETFPWRVFIVSKEDKELLNNDMVYKLATPAPAGDYSWIKPGMVAWDWWCNWNLYGVDFMAGVNNKTYQYFIDFAADYHIPYIIMDEGWSVSGKRNLFHVVPEINLLELVEYATARNVGIILWCGYYPFSRDMERVCNHYANMGIKGFKIDFMDRDDQISTDFHRKAAEMTLKYKLLVDFHGTYKPTGLQRTYPNVLNFEGVYGMEQLKWNPNPDQVPYEVTVPYIRMVAGPMDYTPGIMRNSTRGGFAPINSDGMSQGTRCRQLATYVLYEMPLAMMSDNPVHYRAEDACARFIASIPTTWDETVAVGGTVGEWVAIARRKGNTWYVAAISNWEARDLTLDLSFIENKQGLSLEIFKDGINAFRAAAHDYKHEYAFIPAAPTSVHTLKLAPGGGAVLKITTL